MKNQTPAIAEIVDILSKKWVMRIIWELRDSQLTFRELQAACGNISPTVLNNRLKLLQQAQLIQTKSTRGYALSEIAHELLKLHKPLNDWALTWRNYRQSASA